VIVYGPVFFGGAGRVASGGFLDGGAPGADGLPAGPDGCAAGPVFGGGVDGVPDDVPGKEAGFFRTSGFVGEGVDGTILFAGAGAWPGGTGFGGTAAGDAVLFAGEAGAVAGVWPAAPAGAPGVGSLVKSGGLVPGGFSP